MNDLNSRIEDKIKQALLDIESNGDIVITTNILKSAAEIIRKEVSEIYIGMYFTPREVRFFSQLAYEASENDKMFHSELSCVTGYSEKESKELAEKLDKLTMYW
jgi:hypothetical protein